ncbi:MAG: hypothetical protein ACKVU2_04205 [Saprospiraceae bacterium]
MENTQGKDCDKPEDERSNCAKIKLSYPTIEAGGEALKKSVAEWATRYLVSITMPYNSTEEKVKTATLESAAKTFFDSHSQELIENESVMTGSYLVESKDTILLNDGKHITLRIDGNAFTGGNHRNLSVAVATFDCATGNRLTWDDLVSDKAALKALAEKKFVAAYPDLFKPTDGTEPLKFNEEFKFDLPKSYGLVKDGLFFNYEAGEIFLVVHGETQFVLPFSEIGGITKIKN